MVVLSPQADNITLCYSVGLSSSSSEGDFDDALRTCSFSHYGEILEISEDTVVCKTLNSRKRN